LRVLRINNFFYCESVSFINCFQVINTLPITNETLPFNFSVLKVFTYFSFLFRISYFLFPIFLFQFIHLGIFNFVSCLTVYLKSCFLLLLLLLLFLVFHLFVWHQNTCYARMMLILMLMLKSTQKVPHVSVTHEVF